MSDEIPTTPVLDLENDSLPAQKIVLLNQWKEKVEAEIADETSERDKIMAVYKVQKEKFDRLLGVKVRRMKKHDMVINNRKKVLTDIIKEIEIATNDNAATTV